LVSGLSLQLVGLYELNVTVKKYNSFIQANQKNIWLDFFGVSKILELKFVRKRDYVCNKYTIHSTHGLVGLFRIRLCCFSRGVDAIQGDQIGRKFAECVIVSFWY
jgi:hypothetical protein